MFKIVILCLYYFSSSAIAVDECFTQTNEKCLFRHELSNSCRWNPIREGFLCPTKLHQNGSISQEDFCQATCPKECVRKTWLCDDKCISTRDSCKGKCPLGFWSCNEACIEFNEACNETCVSEEYLLCGNNCYTEDGLKRAGLWDCYGECISRNEKCEEETCYDDWDLNCDETKCVPEPIDYTCNGECYEITKPCNDECPLKNQINCDGDCFENSVKYLESKGKWECDGKCLNLTQPCNKVLCSRPNREKNCKGECEIEQTFYDCNGTCQSVEKMCNGICASNERPWKCPDNDWCVSINLCSIHDNVSEIFFIKEVEHCPYIQTNLRSVCEIFGGLRSFKCQSPKVPCKGHRSQCIGPAEICDGKLDCMDRSDELNCHKISNKFDEKNFQDCIVSSTNNYLGKGTLDVLGFQCGKDICLDQKFWCSSEHQNSDLVDNYLKKECGYILEHLQNEQLCTNPIFWKDRNYNNKEKLYRCNGNYPGEWSEGPDSFCNDFEHSMCKDKSDLVCPLYSEFCIDSDSNKLCSDHNECIHKDLWCDGFKHCSDGSDENPIQCSNCSKEVGEKFQLHKEKYGEVDLIPCQHRYNPGHMICAVPCDGVDDLCLNNSDEQGCKWSSVIYIVTSVLVLIIITMVLGETFFRLSSKFSSKTQLEIMMAKDDGKIKSLIKLLEMFQDDPNLTDEGILIFEEIHNSESYQCEIKIFANLIFSQEYSFSSKFAKVYFDYESNYHSKKLDLVHLCIMTHMGTNHTSKLLYSLHKSPIICSNTTSLSLGPLNSWLRFQVLRFKPKLIWMNFFIAVIFHIIIFYADFIKDIIFIGVYASYLDSFVNFRSIKLQFLILMFFSIFLPICASLILVISEFSKYEMKYWKKIFLAVVTSPFAPPVTFYLRSRLTSKQQLQSINYWTNSKNEEMIPSKIVDYTTEIRRLGKFFATLRRNEHAFEHFTQVSMLIIFITLKHSNTPNKSVIKELLGNSVLEDLFAGNSMELIVLSAFWSFFSLILDYLAWISFSKGTFLPTKGHLILSMFALLSLLARISSVVLYFAPALGLFNLLGHYTMGSLPTTEDILVYDLGDNGTVLRTFQDAWGKPIGSYQDLTYFSLEAYYISFLCIIILHYIFVFIIKCYIYREFRSVKHLLEKLFHVLTQLVYPINFKDWDEAEGSSVEKNWRKTLLEMKLLISLFAIEHFLACVPLFILTSKIRERNVFLDQYFPQVAEEQIATKVAYSLSIIFPIFYMTLPFLQYQVFLAYHKFGHPWSKILTSQLNATDESKLKSDNCEFRTELEDLEGNT